MGGVTERRRTSGRLAPPLNDRVLSMRRVLACEQCSRLSGVSACRRAGFSGTLKALEAPVVIRLLLAVAQRRPCSVLDRSKATSTPRRARSFHASITSTCLKRRVSCDQMWNQRRRRSYTGPRTYASNVWNLPSHKPRPEEKDIHVTELCLNHVCNSYLVFKKRALDAGQNLPPCLPGKFMRSHPPTHHKDELETATSSSLHGPDQSWAPAVPSLRVGG